MIFRILLTTLTLLLICMQPTEARKISITVGGHLESVEGIECNDVSYFSFSELASQLGGVLDWERVGYTITYVDDTLKLRFLVGSPYVGRGARLYNFVHPAMLKDGQLYLPTSTFLPILENLPDAAPLLKAEEKGESIHLDRSGSRWYTVPDIGIASKANGLLIEIALSEPRAYDIFITEGNWLNISIRDAKIDARQVLSRQDRRYLYDLKVHQQGTTGQISMRLKRDIKNWQHTYTKDSSSIQISIIDDQYQPPTISAPSVTVPSLSVNGKIDVVIIDAGHGGADYGAIGPTGKREKDATLAIAKRVQKLLEADKNFKVIMTRDEDKTVSLNQRAKIANTEGADLFVSIHANASPKSSARGWNVFYLAPARNDSARAAEQFENSFFLREQSALVQHQKAEDEDTNDDADSGDSTLDPIANILSEMLMTEFQDESEKFALLLEHQMRSLPVKNRGVDQAGFFVLNKVYMPSVLIETGFITNKTEEKTLLSSQYQRQVAQAIYDAIKQFRLEYQ